MTARSSDWEPLPDIADQRPLAPGSSTNTWAIWVMAVLPLVGILITLAQNPAAQLQQALTRSEQQLQAARSGVVTTPTVAVDGFTALSFLLSVVLVGVQVLLAVADQRALAARGVVRPFPWGWAFLNPTYLIGRHVVVRRRVHGSLAPLWLWIVVQAVAIVGLVAIYIAAFSAAFSSISVR